MTLTQLHPNDSPQFAPKELINKMLCWANYFFNILLQISMENFNCVKLRGQLNIIRWQSLLRSQAKFYIVIGNKTEAIFSFQITDLSNARAFYQTEVNQSTWQRNMGHRLRFHCFFKIFYPSRFFPSLIPFYTLWQVLAKAGKVCPLLFTASYAIPAAA